MEIKAQIVIMSHLSDIQEGALTQKEINHKLNFVKFLIQRYPNTTDKLDPDKNYEDFKKKHPNL
jgi:glutathione peroxidase-family protein